MGDKDVEARWEDVGWERGGKRWGCGGGEGRWQEEDWDRGAGETGARGGDGGRGWKGTGWGEKMCTSVELCERDRERRELVCGQKAEAVGSWQAEIGAWALSREGCTLKDFRQRGDMTR